MWRRVLLAAAIVLIGLPAAVVALALVIINTDWGRERLAGLIEAVTEAGPVEVRVGGITGSLPARVGIVDLRLADAGGEFAAFRRIELSWSPLSLLAGTVEIQAIEVTGGSVERAPVLPEDPTADAPGGPPSLRFPAPPVALRLNGLRIADLRLGEALAGRAATVSAEVSGAVDGAAATARGWLEARSADGAARVDLDVAVNPADGTLRAEIRAHEPQGGLIAGLLGLPDRPALDLSLTGQGTLADWRGRLVGGFGAGAGLDLALAVASVEAGTIVTVDGSAALLRLLPDDLRPLVGPSVGVGVTARIAPDGSVAVERASATAAAAALSGTAALAADGLPVAADLRLALPDLQPFSDLAATPLAGGLALHLRLLDGGRRASLTATGAPVAGGIATGELSLEATASADTTLAALPATLAWRLEGAAAVPDIAGTDLPALLGRRVTLSAAGTAATDGSEARADHLLVVSEAGRLEAMAALSDGRRITATGTVAVADLARFGGLAGRDLAGAATVGFDGTVLLDPLDVSAVVDLGTTGLGLGDPVLAGLVGPAPGLTVAVTLDAANRLSIHGLTLQLAAARATGDAGIDLAGGGLDGRIDLSAPDLAAVGRAVGADLAGAGTAALALGGTLDAPTASASWRLAPLSVQGTRLTEVSGTATASGLPSRPSGRVDMKAVAGRETVTLGAGYALDGDRLRVDGLALEGAGLRGRGKLALDLAGPLADGELSLRSSDLSRLAAFAGAPVDGGTLDLAVGLTARAGQAAKLSGSLRDLSLGGGATEVSSVVLSGEGRDLLRRPSGSLRAEVGTVHQDGAAVLEKALLTVGADGSAARVGLTLDGEAGVRYRVAAAATADLRREPLRISLEKLDASVADAVVALDRPTLITLGPGPRFDDLALRVDGGRITGAGRLDPADLDAALTMRGLPAGLARLADPGLKLSGGIDADATIRGPLGDPTARLTVSAPAIRTMNPAMADLPPLQAAAELRVEDRRLTASLDASVGEGVTAGVRAAARLRAGATGAPPTLDESGPLQAKVDLEAALERVSAFLPLDGGRLAGQASLHVEVTGTPADPDVGGIAAVTDGVLEQSTVGLYLRDIQLAARGRGERLVIERLTASAVSGGSLSGEGGLSLDVSEGMPADLRLTASRLTAVDTDEAEIAVDADLTFTGRLPEYRLAGTVTVLPSEIRIPEQLPPSVVELEVTEVRDGVVVRSPEQEAANDGGGVPVVLDLRIDIPGQVFVRGRGLDSEWGGGLTVTGRADEPGVDGRIEVRRGRFDGLGRSFGFERGRVLFEGGPPDDPTLDMILATEVADIVAKVVVSGRAQDPKIALTSEPGLPEEEILSRILFGSPRAQLSPLQALKLAQSAAVLSGRLGSGGGVTDRVRETLGVDTLDIDAGGEGARGASLSVGKYVAPGVFLKLQQGLGAAGSRAVVEVEITDNITVETDVGADSQSSVGVNWKVDY